MTFLLTKTPILANTDTTNDIFNNLPIGILILEKEIIYLSTGYKIHFANILSRRLLQIPKDNNITKFIEKLQKFKEFNIITQSETNDTLLDHIFSTNPFEQGRTFISPTKNLLFVKVKNYYNKILISVDNYSDERIGLQNKCVQSIGYQYLLTLYHEINNPLNSLIGTVGDFMNQNELNGDFASIKKQKRMELLVFLIQFFLKNFILFFQIRTINKKEIKNENSEINLENLFNSIKEKFSKLFVYKQIKQNEDLSLLKNKNVDINYYYFKNLIKMIYIYFYHKNEKGDNFSIIAERTSRDDIIKIIFSNGKPNDIRDILIKSYSSLSENEKTNNSKPKNKIQTTEMTEEIITKISMLLNIKAEIHNESSHVSVILYVPVNQDEILCTDCDVDELSPQHHSKLVSLSRDIGNNSLYDMNHHFKSQSDFVVSSEHSVNIKKGTKHPNLIGSLFKTIAKTGNNKSIMKDENIINMLHKNTRQNSYPTIKRCSMTNDFTCRSLERRAMTIHSSSSSEDNNYQIHSYVKDSIDSQSEGSSVLDYESHRTINSNKQIAESESPKRQSIKRVKTLNKENEKELTPFTFISIAQIDNDKEDKFELKRNVFRHPYSKKKTDVYIPKNKIDICEIDHLAIPTKKESFKTVVSHISSELSFHSTCSCLDVMIVDDEQFNQSCLNNMLLKCKIKSDLCYNGKECLEKIHEKIRRNCTCSRKHYRLILMDVLMPQMNGLEATERIQSLVNAKTIDSNISVVFISACVDQVSIFEELKQKIPIAKEFLLKPVKRSKIDEILKKYYYI